MPSWLEERARDFLAEEYGTEFQCSEEIGESLENALSFARIVAREAAERTASRIGRYPRERIAAENAATVTLIDMEREENDA
jgi:hypothetical protein